MRPLSAGLESGGWLAGEIWLKSAGLHHKVWLTAGLSWLFTTFVCKFPVQVVGVAQKW